MITIRAIAVTLVIFAIGTAGFAAQGDHVERKPVTAIRTQTTQTEATDARVVPATAQDTEPDAFAGEQIARQVISSGGNTGSAGNFVLGSTLGQPFVGRGNDATNYLTHGFWLPLYNVDDSCCGRYTDGYTGNTNCSVDGKRTLFDITRLIDHVYISKTPLCCHGEGNTDGTPDGKITLADITRLIDHTYVSKQETEPCL